MGFLQKQASEADFRYEGPPPGTDYWHIIRGGLAIVHVPSFCPEDISEVLSTRDGRDVGTDVVGRAEEGYTGELG
jgi:hypothetical protein